jgi:hypothetical protein
MRWREFPFAQGQSRMGCEKPRGGKVQHTGFPNSLENPANGNDGNTDPFSPLISMSTLCLQ